MKTGDRILMKSTGSVSNALAEYVCPKCFAKITIPHKPKQEVITGTEILQMFGIKPTEVVVENEDIGPFSI